MLYPFLQGMKLGGLGWWKTRFLSFLLLMSIRHVTWRNKVTGSVPSCLFLQVSYFRTCRCDHWLHAVMTTDPLEHLVWDPPMLKHWSSAPPQNFDNSLRTWSEFVIYFGLWNTGRWFLLGRAPYRPDYHHTNRQTDTFSRGLEKQLPHAACTTGPNDRQRGVGHYR